jgi:predicted double-glycine peptidase
MFWALALLLPFRAQAVEPRLPAAYLPVPLTAQATSYSCGAAALAGILRYWKVWDEDETALYPLLNTTPLDGTHPVKLVAGARRYGLQAALREGLELADLAEALKRRETVILDIQAWPENDPTPDDWGDNWEDGHYVVLVGLDRDFIYVMDPSSHLGYGYIPRAELAGRWHDYETEDGKRREYRRMAISISGKESLPGFPAPLQRVR